MKTRFFLFAQAIVLSLAIAIPAWASRTVEGIVRLQDDNTAAVGVNIILKGKPIGTTTDAEGRFKFPGVNVGDVLVFSFIGCITQEYTVTENTPDLIEITLITDAEILIETPSDEAYAVDRSRSFGSKLRAILTRRMR